MLSSLVECDGVWWSVVECGGMWVECGGVWWSVMEFSGVWCVWSSFVECDGV